MRRLRMLGCLLLALATLFALSCRPAAFAPAFGNDAQARSVSGFPDVAYAELQLHEYWADEPYSVVLDVHQITADWTESGVTWNNLPALGPAEVKQGTVPSAIPSGSVVDVTFQIDVTRLVQAWASGTANYGLLLKQPDTAHRWRRLDSSENASEKGPSLWVRYAGQADGTPLTRIDCEVIDTFVYESTPTTNYGESVALQVAGWATCRSYVLIKFAPRCTGTIGDLVWWEKGTNTSFDQGDVALAGAWVSLYDTAGNLIQGPVQTGLDGIYHFYGLCPGAYVVKCDPPSGYEALSACISSDDGSDSTRDNQNHCSGGTTVTLGNLSPNDNPYIDFGFRKSCTGRIGDQVWAELDQDPDDISYDPDKGDQPLEGVWIVLAKLHDDGSTESTASVSTDASGWYEFDNLCAGNYKVCYELPFGYSELPGSTDLVDDTTNSKSHTNCRIVPLDDAKPTNLNIDFGFKLGTDYCPPDGFQDCPPPVGTLTTSIVSGNLVVRYAQNYINDNTYGTGADWHHSFSDLVGSDKAQFIFRDKSGNIVLDFLCDYISRSVASAAVPSGYDCLGATGGEGAVITGSAAYILSATTSLDWNLNGRGIPFDPTWLVNSPNRTDSGWDIVNWYEVVINPIAFGAKGLEDFGSVAIGAVHNSPHRCGSSNAITPVLCAGGSTNPDTCAFTAVLSSVKDRLVKVDITNTGTGTLVASRITITWPTSTNGRLKKVKLDGQTLYDAGSEVSPLTIGEGGTPFKSSAILATYTVNPGEKDQLIFEFERRAAKSGYIIDVGFTGDDCGFVL